MTREEILAMSTGKDMNLLIAEHVLGWIAWKEQRGEYTHVIFQRPGEREPYMRSQQWKTDQKRYEPIPFTEIDRMKHIVSGLKDWSSDISAAWEVEEKIKEIGGLMIGYYMTELMLIVRSNGFNMVHATPEQRCKAALLAILPGEE
ncbi:hypothetical protein QYF50_18795 [Paenibacillus vini]|uniref:BC1872 family protein n=1 Tax=Paenibacillus vini TaxID=1476024 RepID=UPI0025B68C06|nr:hypothetical protein [Paenibacillus vini]MDN4069954.1 hypothetical protein [Paenibacillus vini]